MNCYSCFPVTGISVHSVRVGGLLARQACSCSCSTQQVNELKQQGTIKAAHDPQQQWREITEDAEERSTEESKKAGDSLHVQSGCQSCGSCPRPKM